MLLKCTAFTSLEINKILFQEEKFESELLEVGEFLTNVNRNYFSSSPEKKVSRGRKLCKMGDEKTVDRSFFKFEMDEQSLLIFFSI